MASSSCKGSCATPGQCLRYCSWVWKETSKAQDLADGNDGAKLELSQMVLNCMHKVASLVPGSWLLCPSAGTRRMGLLPGSKPCLARSSVPEYTGQDLIGRAFNMHCFMCTERKRKILELCFREQQWCHPEAGMVLKTQPWERKAFYFISKHSRTFHSSSNKGGKNLRTNIKNNVCF